MMRFGPGVSCASAKVSANWRSLSQCCTSTEKRCISGTAELPPPIANSDSTAKKLASVSSVPLSLFISAPKSSYPYPSDADAYRYDHRQHQRQRPVQKPDGNEGRQRDERTDDGAIAKQRPQHLGDGC